MTIWQTITGAAQAAARSDAIAPLLKALGIEVAEPSRGTAGVAFTIAIVALSAKMAKSDGRVTDDEVAAFRRVCAFPETEADNVRRVFDLAKQDIAGFETYARQIKDVLGNDAQLKRDVLEGLFVIAVADGILHEREDAYLARVADLIGIPTSEVAWIRSLFVKADADPYTILGLKPGASNEEIRARHRQLVLENHPDRLIGRGVPAEFVAIAEKTLAAINNAYDQLKRERGL
jgi:DnaJ like chaperone protein